MESYFNNFLTKFIKSNNYIIKNVQYTILVNRGQEPYIATEFLEKINERVYYACESFDDNLEPFVYNVFDDDYCKVYKNDLNSIIKKISFEIMYLITHTDFDLDTCEIINNNKCLHTTLIQLQKFFYLNRNKCL
jgi:hypothetical protein